MIGVEVPQNKKNSERKHSEGRKGVKFYLARRNKREREREKFFLGVADGYVATIEVKGRKRKWRDQKRIGLV